MPNNTIDIGFEINGVNVPGFTNVLNSGTYNNTNTLSNGYVFTGSVGSGANQTCSAIYCHGSTLTGGSNTSPSWVGGTGQVQCGTCHGASSANPPTTASHSRHAGAGAGQLQIPCASCHGVINDTKHVRGTVKWNFAAINGQYKTPSGRYYTMSGSTGRLAPSSSYGTCNTIYCHSNGGPNGAAIVYATMTWGGAALNCGSCHANMSTVAGGASNGGHFKHASAGNAGGPALECSSCHTGYTATTTNGATHANKLVELSTVTGYSKASPMAASGAWGTCSASQCHGQATGLAWNNGSIWQSGGDRCTTCHSSTASGAVTPGNPFYSTEYPTKQTLNTNAKVGAHTLHLTNLNVMNASLNCADCHGAVALKDSTHMNGVANFKWSTLANYSGALTPTYNPATGTCSNVYCHGAAMPGTDTSGNNRSPSWKTPFMPASLTPESCKSCHGFPPVNANHPSLATPTSFPTDACSGCHPNMSATGTTYADIFVDKSVHINRIVNATGGGCNGCHGYPPANKRFKGTQNNWSSARMENYTGGGGAHTVAGHISPSATPDQGWANCTNCHKESDHAMSPLAFKPSSNIKVSIDPKFKFSVNRTPKYTSNNLDGALHVPGNCSNVSCHFRKSPTW
jgi:predicted CxxxxCH...CXXCH cytochrome family protein